MPRPLKVVATLLLAYFLFPATQQVVAQYKSICFLEEEKTVGLNKVCIYRCADGGGHAVTIASFEVCPVTVDR